MPQSISNAGFLRRFAALLYDLLILTALLLLATLAVMPFGHGKAIPPSTLWFQAYLLAVISVFYGGFWLRGGQTLGMLAWRICLVTRDNTRPRLSHIIRRMLFALPSMLCLGLGFLWLLFDKEKRTLYDRLSGTKVIRY